MLLRPQLPGTPPLPTPTVQQPAAPCVCQHQAPAPRSGSALPIPGTGVIAVVLVGGVVATALLAAVAVTAVSVAVAAVVLRSLLTSQRHR
ncbi:SpdD protein [Streptomyces sp. NPDC127033]|uniref:SpdD protein n=1 Tax=Streptomyces sp. NPDC127033 TaxID=3347110 RepID=UPI0036624CB3